MRGSHCAHQREKSRKPQLENTKAKKFNGKKNSLCAMEKYQLLQASGWRGPLCYIFLAYVRSPYTGSLPQCRVTLPKRTWNWPFPIRRCRSSQKNMQLRGRRSSCAHQKGISRICSIMSPLPVCGRAPITTTAKPGTCTSCAVRQLIAKSLLGLPQQQYSEFFTLALLI
ncbi:predicted protein [Clavispora lusitaniae ATCC 42720]|uniref:Uncharacterized protein n=1 Tax=Clavispora lusitaniae (strain ATCC 42720) TaxID=306902 RepID=C4YAX3_CLAL4|nr:uncharacterized protein CLUG_05438 [Clavispora lusitaniae ATCC 42720]EEQ41310.1 predicted protein [Clavispora lusitaniae ATCC 42720]